MEGAQKMVGPLNFSFQPTKGHRELWRRLHSLGILTDAYDIIATEPLSVGCKQARCLSGVFLLPEKESIAQSVLSNLCKQ